MWAPDLRMFKVSSLRPLPLRAHFQVEEGTWEHHDFTTSVWIGRATDCQICIPDEIVSRYHAKVEYEDGGWWITDLDSSNGVYVADERVDSVRVDKGITITLGVGGPPLRFEPVAAPPVRKSPGRSGDDTVLSHYIDRYFKGSKDDRSIGEHTRFLRKAFDHMQRRQRRRYSAFIAALAVLVVGVAGYALYQAHELAAQREAAKELFYEMKALDVELANLESQAPTSGDEQALKSVKAFQGRRNQIEAHYDQFLTAMHFYGRKMPEQDRLILRVARIFGECELDMPKDFVAEVNKYIGYWRGSGRFAKDVNLARDKGYVNTISREFLDQGLPPQFFYLAMQESDFDPYSSGPPTRKGIAKGMWQFIPETAVKYDLRVGPLVDQRRPDPGDDRHNWTKETKAAAQYIKDLYGTDAQASGLLVMACYNWGENQVLPLVRSMPKNPRDRNFWQLLAKHRDQIPQETYDYVFYIVSAAVIGENPRLFGIRLDNPVQAQP